MSKIRINEIIPGSFQTPILRLAEPIDPNAAAAEDPLLFELMQWATTIVKLPRLSETSSWLSDDLEKFPPAFLLFSPHVSKLLLDDRTTGKIREIEFSKKRDITTIQEGESFSRWKVFQRQLFTSDLSTAARNDANAKDIDRESLPIIWAVPLDKKRRSRGAFWAFFPTHHEMTLTGILNAPWKTNSDRQNLLEGEYNFDLLKCAIKLVSQSIPQLYDKEDPGGLLDLLPARDTVGWADRFLSDNLYQKLRNSEIVSDGCGLLKQGSSLKLRNEYVAKDNLQEWLFSVAGDGLAEGWCHFTLETKERRARAKKLGCTACSWPYEWIKEIVANNKAEFSLIAVQLLGELWPHLREYELSRIRGLEFIATVELDFKSPNEGNIYLPNEAGVVSPGSSMVHPVLAENEKAVKVLNRLGIWSASPIAELKDYVKKIEDGDEIDWDAFWRLTRQVECEEARAVLNPSEIRLSLMVKVVSGGFYEIFNVLMPGEIVSPSSFADKNACVDTSYHEPDLDLLAALGCVEAPQERYNFAELAGYTSLYGNYIKDAKKTFIESLEKHSSKPDRSYLRFYLVDQPYQNAEFTHGPLDPITQLSEEATVRFLNVLLPKAATENKWIMAHSSRRSSYPILEFDAPSVWVLKNYGYLLTSLGVKPVAEAVSQNLSEWSSLFPVAQCSADYAKVLDLPAHLEEVKRPLWMQAFELVESVEQEEVLGAFYAHASKFFSCPDMIYCFVGHEKDKRNPAEVYVASSEVDLIPLRAAKIPAIFITDPQLANLLILNWGLQKSESPKIDYLPSDSDVLLFDQFPGLKEYLGESGALYRLQPCTEIWVDVFLSGGGCSSNSLARVKTDHLFCYLEELEQEELLEWISSEFALNLSADDYQNITSHLLRAERKDLVSMIVAESEVWGKLLVALGAETLRNRLPESLLVTFKNAGHEPTDKEISEAAMAVFGVEVLKKYTDDLEVIGLDPPLRWDGGEPSLRFVRELGFPSAYAGFEGVRRSPYEEVDGPIDLNPLHPFQEKVAANILQFLDEAVPQRGLLSLPTGAGKTRVVVETLIRSIRSGKIDQCVVWIAQSDELCEQALQTWLDVWRGLGPQRKMRISRLWGQTNKRVFPVKETFHLVITTFQTLHRRVDRESFDWLKNPACVVIDEAHGSTTRSYTEILKWFSLDQKQTTRPLIGITATPFRGGSDEDETRRLVNRYGAKRFDHGVFEEDDPYPYLQKMKILSQVEHQTLIGGDIVLESEELEHLKQYLRLPPSAEKRLGQFSSRNDSLVESILKLPNDWPVLVFATSVDHAGLLAALLSLAGISSKSISSETDMRARRYYIDEFKRGKIRVLTNYNVLTTGFDAPAVRALYIARPVYSHGLYQQMIGRGLRGPLNGGKDICLIVNVADNITQFGEKLAFRHFEALWQKTDGSIVY